MNRSTKGVVVVLAGLGVIAVLLWVLTRSLGNGEALYEGRVIGDWLVQASSADAGASNQAVRVLTEVAVPALRRQVFADTNDSPARLWIIDQLDSLPGLNVNYVTADGRRRQAMADLGSLGPRARAAIPDVLEILRQKDPVLVAPAAQALSELKVEPSVAIPALLSCVKDTEGNGDPEVVKAIAEYGPQAKAAVPILIGMLNDRSSKEIVVAVPQALKAIDPQSAATQGIK